MGFEELFENNRKDFRNIKGTNYPDDNQYSSTSRYPYHENEDNEKWQNILEKIKGNKKVRVFVIWAAILLLAITIVLIIALLPLIVKLFNFVTQNGVQGVINEITGFIDKIMNGTSN